MIRQKGAILGTKNQENFDAIAKWRENFIQRADKEAKQRLPGSGAGMWGAALTGKAEWLHQIDFQRLIVEQNRIMIEQLNLILEQFSRIVE